MQITQSFFWNDRDRKIKVSLAGILLFCGWRASVYDKVPVVLQNDIMLSNHDKEHNKTFHFDLKNRPTHSQEVDCLEVRGTYGTWEQDLEYASRVQYIPIMGFRQKKHKRQQNKRQQQGMQHILSSTNNTSVERDEISYNVHLQVMTRQGFCSVLQTLGIQNVYMAGDSMMQAMYISLLRLIRIYTRMWNMEHK